MTLLLILYDLVINYMTFVGHQGGIWSVKNQKSTNVFLQTCSKGKMGNKNGCVCPVEYHFIKSFWVLWIFFLKFKVIYFRQFLIRKQKLAEKLLLQLVVWIPYHLQLYTICSKFHIHIINNTHNKNTCRFKWYIHIWFVTMSRVGTTCQ